MLEEQYITPKNCRNVLAAEYKSKWSNKFDNANQDIDSRLETYIRINPVLSKPKYLDEIMLETDRVLLTRFRCGSHSLQITRNQRFCLCT